MRIFSMMAIMFSLVGCNYGQKRLQEKAKIESEASAQKQIEAANSNLAKKASEMEADLSTRQRFYQAIKGTYEGTLDTEQGTFQVRLTFVPSLPPNPPTDRTRSLDEIVSDLNNLYFNAQIVQWNPKNRLSAVGCRVEHVRPDISGGEIAIASENCPNVYLIRISESGAGSKTDEPKHSAAIASDIRDGRLDQVADLSGEVQPTTNASIYLFSARRVRK